MNVLFLARRFYPDVGGVEKHVLKISELLIKNGHSVTVITESHGKDNSIRGLKIFRINSRNGWFKKFDIWVWLWRNRELIKKADVVHAHDVYYWYFPFRLIYPSKKSFVTFHGYESYPIRKRAIIMRKISEKLSNGNIIVGDFIKKWYGTKPNSVIYGAVDVPKTIKPARNKMSAVFIGRVDVHTGILDYAKAVDLLRQKYPEFQFKIYGDGELKSQLAKYHPEGFIENAEKAINNYNFAFVSRYLSVLEALANKRLVFALYDNPVKEDYLKMSPFAKFIIIESSPEKLRDKIEYFLNNPEEEKKMIDKGFDWAKNQTWERVKEFYLKLWEK